MVYKINIIVLFVFFFCCFMRVYSEDPVTVYVTVSANSTKEEATTTVEEIPTPTVRVEDTDEYKRFENALSQTKDDDCTYHAYIVSLNLFHANEIGNTYCENRYYDSLDDLAKENPCERYSKNVQFSYGLKYFDANIRALCQEVNTNHTKTEELTMEKTKELCPIVQQLKLNRTEFERQLFEGCSIKNDTKSEKNGSIECIDNILVHFKEMQLALSKIKSEYRENGISYTGLNNEKIHLKFNLTLDYFDRIASHCPKFAQISDISSAVSLTISFITILVSSLFIILINM